MKSRTYTFQNDSDRLWGMQKRRNAFNVFGASRISYWLLACLQICMFSIAARADLKSDAAREKKPCMVLCVGGDWCVSGEKVRGVYDSTDFRKAFGGRWLFGVRDAREAPPPAGVSNENARVKSLDTGTSRYPALILFNSRGEGVGRRNRGALQNRKPR